MDDTRTRDARSGRPRRELPESLAWLYEQPADEHPSSGDDEPLPPPPPAPQQAPAPAAPPRATTPRATRAPADPESLPTLLPFSAEDDDPREAPEFPSGPFAPGALLAPPDRSSSFLDLPDASSPVFERPDRSSSVFERPDRSGSAFAGPDRPSSFFAPPDEPATWADPVPRTYRPEPSSDPAPSWPPVPAAQLEDPPALRRLFDTPRFAQPAQPAPRPIPAENWPTTPQPHDASAPDEHREPEQEPVGDAAVVDAPAPSPVSLFEPVGETVVEEPTVEERAADEVEVPEPVVEAPAIEEPVAEEPVAQEPVVAEPAVDDVEPHEPVVHEPVVQEPVVQEPPVVPPRPELGDPALGTLWSAVRDALQSSARHAQPSVDVRGLDQAGRRAVAGLLGVPAVRAATRVELADLEAVVTETFLMSLAAAAERYVPLGGRRARTQTRTAAVRAGQEWLQARPGMAALPWTATWLETIRRDTVSGDAGLTGHEVTTALAVLESLAGPGATQDPRGWRVRAEVAAQVADDEHALDEGSAVAALVLRGLAAAAGTALPSDPAGRRRLWARHGVLPDLVSATCLAVGVAPADEAHGRRWRLAALDGVPAHATARDLRATAAWVPVDECWPAVLVVDNPRVLDRIAGRFGARVPAVWVDGTSDVLALDLVARLFESGTAVRFVTDFDQAGLALGSLLAQRFGATPWRMSADVYRRAVRSDLPLLPSRVPDAEWAPGLAAAMTQSGRALPAEQVLEELLAALGEEVGGPRALAPA